MPIGWPIGLQAIVVVWLSASVMLVRQPLVYPNVVTWPNGSVIDASWLKSGVYVKS